MTTLKNNPVEQEESRQEFGLRFWDFFTKPASAITDRAEKRQARVLSSFLLVFILLTGIRMLVGLSSGSYLEEPAPFVSIAVLEVFLLLSYGLSRTRKFVWGSGVAVVSTIVLVLLTVVLRDDLSETRVFQTLMWLIPAFILGSAFFSWRGTLVVSTLTLASIWVMPFVVPGLEIAAVISSFSILLVVSVLLVVVNRFRDQLEADRLVEFNAANQELTQAREFLEQRVTERTQALQLATEISRVLSQITNLDELLQKSVETVRAQFDLYYVQIYLADATARSLILQAGTGTIGQELTRRGHGLVIGSSSINGLAAAEKRSVIVADTAVDPLFRPNSLLPYTRSEMAVPLIIGTRVVGTLDLQSEIVSAMSADNLSAFEALAGQLAVAIENARLISEVAKTRAEVESFSRRITREGWSSYLDAVERPQFMGYSYQGDVLTPITLPLAQGLEAGNVAQVSIDVIGESVGAIQIEADESRYWTADDLDLIQMIATQVGQQVEILRSLDEATHFRQQAEQTLRRITHEAWLLYEDESELADGFVYHHGAIKAETAVSAEETTPDMIQHNLSLNGETVGELIVSKSDTVDEDFTHELLTAVADQLVSHMESLRLSEQTEIALAESQRRSQELVVINRVVSKISQVVGMQESMQIVVDELKEVTSADQIRIALLNNERTKLTIIAENYDHIHNTSALGLEIPVAGNMLTEEVIQTRKAIFVADCQTSPYTASIRDMLAEQHIQSFLVMPIVVGSTVIGTAGLDILTGQKSISDDQIQLAETLILQAGSAIQKAQLFEETQARAEELAVINEVAQIVAQQIDRQALVKSVHEQIRRILTVDTFFIALYDVQKDVLEFPYIFDNNRVFETPPDSPSLIRQIHQIFETGEIVVINRTQAEIDELAEALDHNTVGDPQYISASLLYIPLRLGYETLGVLSVQSYQFKAYNQANIDLLSGIAYHVAASLENSRLMDISQQNATREQVLREISATINTSIDAESVLQTAAREIGRALGVETFVYLTPDIAVTKLKVETSVGDKQNGNGATP